MELDFFLSDLTEQQLQLMADAAIEVNECVSIVRKSGRNMVHEVTDGGKGIKTKTSYPPNGFTNFENGTHFYFHIHRDSSTEYGHFHTYGYPRSLDNNKIKSKRKLTAQKSIRDKQHAHLIAISVNKYGAPINLFTTNKWVTKEVIYPQSEVIDMLDHYAMNSDGSLSPLERWTAALLVMFRPQIIWLISQRDATLESWKTTHPESNVYEDKALEVLADIDISIDEQQKAVNALLERC